MAAEVGQTPNLPALTDRWSVNVAQLTESMDGKVRALTDLLQQAGSAQGAKRQQLEAAMVVTRRELRALDEVLARALREEGGVLPGSAAMQKMHMPELKFTSRDEEESIVTAPITSVEPKYLNSTDVRPKFQVHQLATLGMPPPRRPQPPIPVLVENTDNKPPSPLSTPATGEISHEGVFFPDQHGHGVSREASKPVARRHFSNVGAEKGRGSGEVDVSEERDVVGEEHRTHIGSDQAARNRSASTPHALGVPLYSPVLATRTFRSQSVDGGGQKPPKTPTHTGGLPKRRPGELPMDVILPMDPQHVLSPKQLGAIVRTWRAAVGGREGGEAFPLACMAMEYRVTLADHCPEVAARMLGDMLYLTELFSTLVSVIVPSLTTRRGPAGREQELSHIAATHYTLGFGRSTYSGAYKSLYAAVRHRAGSQMDEKAQEVWLLACGLAVDMLSAMEDYMRQAEADTLKDKERARRRSAADKAPHMEVAGLHEPSPKQAGAISCTWRLLAEGCGLIGGAKALALAVLTALFYDELFRRAPNAHVLLQDNLRAQSLYLTQLIANIVPTLDPARQSSGSGPDQDLLLIGPQHAQWGLDRDFYKRSCDAITAVVRSVLGERFDARMREAWLFGCAHACERFVAAQAHYVHMAER